MYSWSDMKPILVILLVASIEPAARAYCAREDGPAVRGARAALKTGDAEQVLIWVPAWDEAAVTEALAEARAVRGLGKAAQKVADQYFIETVARTHCLALNEAFLGIAPAGYDFGPAPLAAEEAVETGQVDRLVGALRRELDRALRGRWNEVQLAKKAYRKGDRDAGRRYAMAYLDFVDFTGAIDVLLRCWRRIPSGSDQAAGCRRSEASGRGRSVGHSSPVRGSTNVVASL